MKQTFTFISLILSIVSINGQKKNTRDTSSLLIQPSRIEFEKNNDRSDFYVIVGDEDGLLVLEETYISATKDAFIWRVHLVDTSLQVVKTRNEIIGSAASLVDYNYFGGDYYILFNKNKYQADELLVYRYSTKTDKIARYELTTAFPLSIKYFEAVGETLLIAGYTNFRPVVITYDLNIRLPRVVPGFYDNKNEFLDITVDDKANLFTVVLTERMKNKKNTIRVKTFNERGDLIEDNRLNPEEKKSLLDGATTTFSGGLQYIAGTYSRKLSPYSQGFYLSKFINGQQQFNKYFPFAVLSNFWNHMKPKRELRILKRIAQKKKKGKVKKFNYRLQVQEILQRGEEYILIAEAYYPRYDYNNNRMGQFYGNRADPYFLGYKYTHAVVVAFDKNGNILWDHTFKIEDKQSFFLKENIVVSLSKDQVALMYLEKSEIRSKIIEKERIMEGRRFSSIRLSNALEKVSGSNSVREKIERWYGDASVAYGEQTIRNILKHDSNTREIFYINKIKYANTQPN